MIFERRTHGFRVTCCGVFNAYCTWFRLCAAPSALLGRNDNFLLHLEQEVKSAAKILNSQGQMTILRSAVMASIDDTRDK